VPAIPALVTVALLAFAQAFDFLTFLRMIDQHGLAAELNPLVVRLVESFDLRAVAIAKLAVLAYVALTVAILANRRPRLARSILTIGVVAGLLGGASNIATI
jgi:hypothetical protein